MKFPRIKRKTGLLVLMILWFTGLVLNVWGLVYYIGVKDNWRTFKCLVWIVIFSIAVISSYFKYRKELQTGNSNSKL